MLQRLTCGVARRTYACKQAVDFLTRSLSAGYIHMKRRSFAASVVVVHGLGLGVLYTCYATTHSQKEPQQHTGTGLTSRLLLSTSNGLEKTLKRNRLTAQSLFYHTHITTYYLEILFNRTISILKHINAKPAFLYKLF